LQTNTPSKRLEFQNVKKAGGAYQCFLIVESNGFCAARSFYFGEFYLKVFLENLIEMDKKFDGRVVLKHEHEHDQISIVCERTGHIIVSGSLFGHSQYSQDLTFYFQTDQTNLKPLIQDF
jgi:hypothetical protein